MAIVYRSVLIGAGGAGIPDGEFILPINDVKMWARCAQQATEYTTIEQVLADSTLLLALIQSQNACKYLVRSTAWTSDVCSDEIAMRIIGANDYCSSTLLNNETWFLAICNSSYFESVLNLKIPVMVSNTAPSGVASASGVWKSGYEAYKAFNGNTSQTQGWINTTETGGWLQYDFGTSAYFYLFDYKGGVNNGYRALKNFKLQGTVDGVDFIDITDIIVNSDSVIHIKNPITKNNHVAYRYIRVVCDTTGTSQAYNGIAVFQVYGRESV